MDYPSNQSFVHLHISDSLDRMGQIADLFDVLLDAFSTFVTFVKQFQENSVWCYVTINNLHQPEIRFIVARNNSEKSWTIRYSHNGVPVGSLKVSLDVEDKKRCIEYAMYFLMADELVRLVRNAPFVKQDDINRLGERGFIEFKNMLHDGDIEDEHGMFPI